MEATTTTAPESLYPLPTGAYLVATATLDSHDDVTYTPAETSIIWPSMGAEVMASLSEGGYPKTGPYSWSLVTPRANLREIVGEDGIRGVVASHYYVIGPGRVVTPEVYAASGYRGMVVRPLSSKGSGQVYGYTY